MSRANSTSHQTQSGKLQRLSLTRDQRVHVISGVNLSAFHIPDQTDQFEQFRRNRDSDIWSAAAHAPIKRGPLLTHILRHDRVAKIKCGPGFFQNGATEAPVLARKHYLKEVKLEF